MWGYLISSAVCGLAAALAAFIICKVKRYKASKTLYIVLFAAYIAAVICLTLISGGKESSRRYQLVPFITLISNISIHNYSYIVQTIGSIVMFIPMGILVGLKKRELRYSLLAGLIFSLAIETTQLITLRGVFDVDDLIFNTIGSIIGYLVIRLYSKLDGNNKISRRSLEKDGGSVGSTML